MTTHILYFIYVKLFKLIDSEMKVYYVTKVLKQGFNIKTMYPHYILELRNMKSHLLQVYLSTRAQIEIDIENMPVKLLVTVIIVFKCYPSTYCLMQGSYFICSDF